jgi:hypothetical protein
VFLERARNLFYRQPQLLSLEKTKQHKSLSRDLAHQTFAAAATVYPQRRSVVIAMCEIVIP